VGEVDEPHAAASRARRRFEQRAVEVHHPASCLDRVAAARPARFAEAGAQRGARREASIAAAIAASSSPERRRARRPTSSRKVGMSESTARSRPAPLEHREAEGLVARDRHEDGFWTKCVRCRGRSAARRRRVRARDAVAVGALHGPADQGSGSHLDAPRRDRARRHSCPCPTAGSAVKGTRARCHRARNAGGRRPLRITIVSRGAVQPAR
jgi:hypothetical protein